MDEPPRLPPELERKILELAALSYPTVIPRLMRVAWRVKEWLEPLLYRTLCFTSQPGLPRCDLDVFEQIVQRKSPAFFKNAVRNVGIWEGSNYALETILRNCPGITNLFFHAQQLQHPLSPQFDAVRLQRLHCELGGQLDVARNPLDHPAFARLTHLELYYMRFAIDNSFWLSLSTALPCLTHLALCLRTDNLEGYKFLLESSNTLRTLVSVIDFLDVDYTDVIAIGLDEDVRFVMILRRVVKASLKHGILTGDDYWARADAFIAQRASGEINSRIFHLPYRDEDTVAL